MTTPFEVAIFVQLPDGSVNELAVTETGPIVVGRDPSCHVVLPTADVSRRHIQIEAFPHGVQLTDTSANGTYVEQEHVLGRSVVLRPQQAVVIGPYTLRFLWNSSPSLPAPMRVSKAPKVQSSATPSIKADPSRAELQEVITSAGSSRLEQVALRKKIHRELLEHLDLVSLDRSKMDDERMRPKVIDALQRIIANIGKLPENLNADTLVQEMTDEALGLGPLEQLLADDAVSEIMVVDPYTIFVERAGKVQHTPLSFTDDESVRAVIERIVTPLGRRIDESTPLVDARLKDGSRVNAVIKPLAIRGACITIRKFAKHPLQMSDLIKFGAFNERMGKFLQRAVKARKNVVISGGTGSGKTTLLNVLSTAIPEDERIVTIEDAAELQLQQPHVVSLETRPANMEGRGAYTIRDLVKNALRMRPDRIVVGECRGGEALDMLQAMNTGHEGSMTTTHANSPTEALARLETLCLMAGLDLPARAIREQIASSVHLILQQTRFSDGSRRVSRITELVGIEDGKIELHDIFAYYQLGVDEKGKVQGEFRASGYLPSFIDEFISKGLVTGGDYL